MLNNHKSLVKEQSRAQLRIWPQVLNIAQNEPQ